MPRYKIDVKGAAELKYKLGRQGADRLRSRVGTALEEGIRDMAEDSYEMAPKDTTALAQSILASVQKEAPLTWYYGSVAPYAQRQEYEHKTKRGYFRRSVNKNKIFIQDRIAYIVESQFK